MSLPDLPVSLADSPEVKAAIQDFVVEAIDEATDLLATGDMATRISLIKLVLSESFKAKSGDSAAAAERLLAETRAAVAGVLEDDPEAL